jgi:hypothetical protein
MAFFFQSEHDGTSTPARHLSGNLGYSRWVFWLDCMELAQVEEPSALKNQRSHRGTRSFVVREELPMTREAPRYPSVAPITKTQTLAKCFAEKIQNFEAAL